MTKPPENKYFLSNNLPSQSEDIRSNLDGIWIINRIDFYDENNKPKGTGVQTLGLGDLIEYIDRELSYTTTDVFIGPVIGQVVEIKEKEVLLSKPNKERYLMGNNSQFINYTPYSYTANVSSPKTTTKISGYVIAISILISIICFFGWMILS